MATWLTSDLHLGHEMVARTRGFDDSDSHDASVAARWSRVVGERDEVWVLGDLALGAWREALHLIGTLPGTKHLVVGNHDRCSPMARNGHNYHEPYRDVFASISLVANLRYGGHDLLLAHLPYTGDRGPDRYPQYRLADFGAPLIHGHLHDTLRYRVSPDGTPMVHVGLDAWEMRPVALADAVALIPTRARGE